MERRGYLTYRLSRARRIVENGFGVLAARWRIYHTKMAVGVEMVNVIIKATCLLHNMVQRVTTPAELFVLGDVPVSEGLQEMEPMGYRGTDEAMEILNKFKD